MNHLSRINVPPQVKSLFIGTPSLQMHTAIVM